MVPHPATCITSTSTLIGMEKKVYSNSQTVEFSGNIGIILAQYIYSYSKYFLITSKTTIHVSFANIQLINNRTG